MARYHTANIKNYIQKNPFFNHIKDMTGAESILKFTKNGEDRFVVEPEGIMSFKRGRHPDIVICDDILADPSQELNLQVIDKINRTFFEDVMSLPKEGGQIILIGTSQHQADLFWQIKKKSKQFVWRSYPAIIDEVNKKVLWEDLFPYERLNQIRLEEIGEKAFKKEYMCSPVYSEDSYFTREQILSVVNTELKNREINKGENIVVAGWDIGKHSHPSHISIFLKEKDNYIMIWQEFFDRIDYSQQLDKIKGLVETLKIDKIYFDATRGELEAFQEQGLMSNSIFKPVIFKVKTKSGMSSNFERLVLNKRIQLINNDRMINQILVVNNNLDAVVTSEGHGDSFWSIAMAVNDKVIKSIVIPYDEAKEIFG